MEKSNKKGAAALNISPHTAETHFGYILQILNLHYPTELALYDVREGNI